MTFADRTPAPRARERIRDIDDFGDGLLAGLKSLPKTIPCKYFYDTAGSKLFEKISALPEYYLTRTELSLLSRHAEDIAALIGPDAEIVEFGAGASEKIRILLAHLVRPHVYMPVDISAAYIKTIAAELEADYPELFVNPIVADFSLALPATIFGTRAKRHVGFFPGSTIGNFTPEEAKRFLRDAASLLKGGGLLIGVDLVKDPAILHAAYNDAAGVTAEFNKNLLARANRELGANFDLARFAHYAPYNPVEQRIEMYLMSTAAQRASVCGRSVAFADGEAVNTEYSYKYTVDGFRALAQSTGFAPRAVWCDADRLFSVHWLEA
jgi:dimethylhistidine N-methyltransferase